MIKSELIEALKNLGDDDLVVLYYDVDGNGLSAFMISEYIPDLLGFGIEPEPEELEA